MFRPDSLEILCKYIEKCGEVDVVGTVQNVNVVDEVVTKMPREIIRLIYSAYLINQQELIFQIINEIEGYIIYHTGEYQTVEWRSVINSLKNKLSSSNLVEYEELPYISFVHIYDIIHLRKLHLV